MSAATQTICIDAALAIAAVVQDDHNHKAAFALIAQWGTQGVILCAPAMFAYECNSVIRMKVSSGKLTRIQAEEALEFLEALGIVIEYDPADNARAYQIATNYHQHRAYDAAYAAHAEARGLEFVTVDGPFFEAVNGSKLPTTAAALTFVKLVK